MTEKEMNKELRDIKYSMISLIKTYENHTGSVWELISLEKELNQKIITLGKKLVLIKIEEFEND